MSLSRGCGRPIVNSFCVAMNIWQFSVFSGEICNGRKNQTVREVKIWDIRGGGVKYIAQNTV